MPELRTLIVIPAYNEGRHIADVLKAIPKNTGKILVVDNASTDNTVEIVKKCNASLLRHPVNTGKASSIIDGFKYAIKNKFDVVVAMDADGEHPPDRIKDFLGAIRDNDVVVGQRKSYRSLWRKILNKWNNLWIQMLLPQIEDTQCGFRAIRTELLKKMSLKSQGFEIEMEMLLEAYKNRARIGTINILTKPIRKTTLKFRDYLRINNFFDRWVLKNKQHLNTGNLKCFLLIMFAYLGLIIFGGLGKLIGEK